MVDLQQEGVELLLERIERQGRLPSGPCGVAVQVAQEHLVHRAKESLDAASPLRLTRRTEHKTDLQVRRHLLQMLRSKVRTVVGVENIWNAADLPVGITFTPDTLTQSQGRAQGRRR